MLASLDIHSPLLLTRLVQPSLSRPDVRSSTRPRPAPPSSLPPFPSSPSRTSTSLALVPDACFLRAFRRHCARDTCRAVRSRDVPCRHVTSRHVTSRHVTSRHVTSRHVAACHVTSRHVTSRYQTAQLERPVPAPPRAGPRAPAGPEPLPRLHYLVAADCMYNPTVARGPSPPPRPTSCVMKDTFREVIPHRRPRSVAPARPQFAGP